MKKNYFKPSTIVAQVDLESLMIPLSGEDTGDSDRSKPGTIENGAKINWVNFEEESDPS